ncbi:hypothetical protein J7E78_24895 [Paenibacillus polymyxa]|nr:hypothetical protein [Paenibacillus polymyxa]MBT2286767.1 hypothetical protein [Paenibacillus polymyxa]
MNKDELFMHKAIELFCKLAKKETNHLAHDLLAEIAGRNIIIALDKNNL